MFKCKSKTGLYLTQVEVTLITWCFIWTDWSFFFSHQHISNRMAKISTIKTFWKYVCDL